MNYTLNVEGMMCSHCEAAVKKCLESLPGVEKATASREKGTVEICMNSSAVSIDDIKKAIVSLGYKVLD